VKEYELKIKALEDKNHKLQHALDTKTEELIRSKEALGN
jgi:hypothetical protein